MSIGSQEFRNTLSKFATGVTVVTGVTPGGEPVGVTISSFTSVSLSPPLVLICLGRETASLDAFTTGNGFVVNILAESQRDLSDRFAFRRADGFDGVDFSLSDGGSPILTGCLASLECASHQVYEGGDHLVVIGRVETTSISDGSPLLHFQGEYHALETSNTDS